MNIFSNFEFGFRKTHSTSHTCTLLTSKITESFNLKLKILGIFLDLSKAFDTIDHTVLLSELYHYGIRGISLQWFKGYLRNKKQQVQINNIMSSKIHTITNGVPQGSILGPLLFLLYINNFPNCMNHSSTKMFADNTSVFVTHPDIKIIYKHANEDLNSNHKLLCTNKLSLNYAKTKYVLLQTAYSKPPSLHLPLQVNEKKIEKVQEINFFRCNLQLKPFLENSHAKNFR